MVLTTSNLNGALYTNLLGTFLTPASPLPSLSLTLRTPPPLHPCSGALSPHHLSSLLPLTLLSCNTGSKSILHRECLLLGKWLSLLEQRFRQRDWNDQNADDAASKFINGIISDLFAFILSLIKMPRYLATHAQIFCKVLAVMAPCGFVDVVVVHCCFQNVKTMPSPNLH